MDVVRTKTKTKTKAETESETKAQAESETEEEAESEAVKKDPHGRFSYEYAEKKTRKRAKLAHETLRTLIRCKDSSIDLAIMNADINRIIKEYPLFVFMAEDEFQRFYDVGYWEK